MRALSIRQPYAGIARSPRHRSCGGSRLFGKLRAGGGVSHAAGFPSWYSTMGGDRIIGERFYIYASKAKAPFDKLRAIWSDDLRVATPPKWMLELAEQVGMIEPGALLPTGVIVGSAVIEKVSPVDSRSTRFDDAHRRCSGRAMYRWHLAGVERAKKFRKPKGHPQPVWFKPF